MVGHKYRLAQINADPGGASAPNLDSDSELESSGSSFSSTLPKLFLQLPPLLSYLCELSILPYLNELPVSLLPPRLAGLFEKWTRLVTVEMTRKSFTNYPSKSKLLSEMIELKIEPDAPLEMVQWLVSKKMDLKHSTASISRSRDEHVDFVGECEVDSVRNSETSESETEELP